MDLRGGRLWADLAHINDVTEYSIQAAWMGRGLTVSDRWDSWLLIAGLQEYDRPQGLTIATSYLYIMPSLSWPQLRRRRYAPWIPQVGPLRPVHMNSFVHGLDNTLAERSSHQIYPLENRGHAMVCPELLL
jgi:hypothetical protein